MKNLLAVIAIASTFSIAGAAKADEAWSGPYFGTYAEVESADATIDDVSCWTACSVPALSKSSLSGGVTAGFNVAVDDSFVAGVEADFGSGADASGYSGNLSTLDLDGVTWRSKTKWRASLRARAGLVVGETMAYVTGGVAFADIRYANVGGRNRTKLGLPNVLWGSDWNRTLTGKVYGAGIEHRFGNLSAKAEFLRSSYGTHRTCFKDLEGASSGVCWQHSSWDPTIVVSPSHTELRVGLNFHF